MKRSRAAKLCMSLKHLSQWRPSAEAVLFLASGMIATSACADLLYTADFDRNVGTYDPVTGTAINPSLIRLPFSFFPIDLAVSNGFIYVTDEASGRVGKYDAATGAVVSHSFLSGLHTPWGVAVSGNTLFVVENGADRVGAYDATTGAPIDVALITNLADPSDLLISGSDLYVCVRGANAIGKYTIAGETQNDSFITGVDASVITQSGSNLFFSNHLSTGGNVIAEYTTDGALVNPVLVGVTDPSGIADGGGHLYVANFSGDVWSLTEGGSLVNRFFISVTEPTGVAYVATVPEPANWTMIVCGFGLLAANGRLPRRKLRANRREF